AQLKMKKCDDCKSDAGLIKRKMVGNRCEIKSDTGRFSLNGGLDDTVLYCDVKSNYKWMKGGKEITEIAAIEAKLEDKVNVGMVTLYVLLGIVLFGIVLAVIVFLVMRKKRAAQRLETLKSKGLEQKNDSIIDAIEVDDTKTLVL
ncbi:hypothetical protein PFISCL1PPCAC_17293, partial [Pristionchus fissidentatus]